MKPLWAIVALTWLLGAFAVLLHLAAAVMRLERIAGARRAVSADLLEWARARLPVRRRARLRVVSGGPFSVPICWGLRRITILLPSHWESWSRSHMETVLRHELIHAARRDTAYLMLTRVAVALHWCNPLAWRLQTMLGSAAEDLCDDLVVRGGVSPAQYASVLLDAARSARHHRRYGIVAAFARHGSLERRIERVLAGARPPMRPLAGVLGGLMVMATSVAATFVAPIDAPALGEGNAARASAVEQDDIVGALIRALDDPAADVRRSAVNSLRDIGGARGIEALRRVLDDPDANVRQAAGAVLGLRAARPNLPLQQAGKPPPASAARLDSLAVRLKDANDRVRLAAARALGNVGDERSTLALTARLDDPQAQVRAAAAAALGNIADARATPALVRAWPDPDAHVRASIASALGAVRDMRGAHVLMAALSDAEVHVRRVAAEALGRVGRTSDASEYPQNERPAPPERVQAAVSTRVPQQPAVCTDTDVTGMELVAAIETLLRDPNAEQRHAAARALGRFTTADLAAPVPEGVKSPHHALEAALSDPSGPVRIAAACSLARVGDARALKMLALRTRAREAAELKQAANWAIRRIEERAEATQ